MNTTEQIIKKCQSGNRKAQSELYRMYAPKLFGVCMRYARNKTEAEDFLHEGFVIIFSKINQFAFKGSFEGWMKRIMVNVSLEKYRTRYRLQTVEDITIYDDEPIASDVIDAIDAQLLVQFISELPPRYQMVFNLYAIDGYTHKEIAEKLGIQEGTSKSNLARARKILQENVKQLGIDYKVNVR